MANIDNTVLTSDNAERFDEITKNLNFKGTRSIDRSPGEIFVRTSWGVPHEEIKELSAKHPDMIFHAIHSFEFNTWDTEYHVDYTAGEDEVVNAVPGYMWPVQEQLEKEVPCYKELLDKVIEVFKRVDIVVDDPNGGGKCIEWCDAEVAVTVEHEGYRMRAKKNLSQIEEIKCYRARETKTVEWDAVIGTAGDFPF